MNPEAIHLLVKHADALLHEAYGILVPEPWKLHGVPLDPLQQTLHKAIWQTYTALKIITANKSTEGE